MKPGKPLTRKTPLTATKPMRKRRAGTTRARQAARGQTCLLNVANVCNYNDETVVLAHLRWLGDCGTSIKPDDAQAVFACSECNRWTDSPTKDEQGETYESDRNFYAARALVRMRWIEQEKVA